MMNLGTVTVGYYVGSRMPTANQTWTQAVERRVAKTSDILSQIKIVKMMGLEKIMTRFLQKLREHEIEYSKKARFWVVILFSVCKYSNFHPYSRF